MTDLAISEAAPTTGALGARAALRRMVLDAVGSAHSRRNYAKGLDDLFRLAGGRPLTRTVLMEYRASMEGLAASTANVRLSAVRKMVGEAEGNGMLSAEEAARLKSVPNIPQRGARMGNWLTREQTRDLLAVPDRTTLKGLRDYALLALLVGCALRRQELAGLRVEDLGMREGRWVIVDLCGKGGRLRTVPVPGWVKQGIDAWTAAAGIGAGRLMRRVGKGGAGRQAIGDRMSDWAIWAAVQGSARQIGVERFGAHDLRRTCAKLCRKAGGDLEQIKFLLGHSSIQTTERYLGSEQELAIAVNDGLGF